MKNGKIYLIQNGDTLATLEERPYQNEDLLQTLLEKYPELLDGEQIDEANPRRWLLVAREVGFPEADGGGERMSLDHLFLDQDGIPTLVEVKRSSDTRIRREVVGQMLDYAANAISFWPMEYLRAQLETAAAQRGEDPDDIISRFLQLEEADEAAVDAFWQTVKTNLQAKKMRLIFVADEIPPSLRRIVEFLNEQMDPTEVLAVELRQYVGEGIQTIVPRLIGQTADAQKVKGRTVRETKQWDEASFFAELAEQQGKTAVMVARKILAWAKEHTTDQYWGKGMVTGSIVPTFVHEQQKHQLFAVWTRGTIELYLAWYRQKRPFDAENLQIALLEKLNCIEGISLPPDAMQRQPSLQLTAFADEARLKQLLSVFEWVIEIIKEH